MDSLSDRSKGFGFVTFASQEEADKAVSEMNGKILNGRTVFVDYAKAKLLVNLHTHQLKLCDFGSAKVLVKGEPNISYICSRYYRAPELIFGATEYTTAIDIWSAGCVLVELLLGQPLFPGEVEQRRL